MSHPCKRSFEALLLCAAIVAHAPLAHAQQPEAPPEEPEVAPVAPTEAPNDDDSGEQDEEDEDEGPGDALASPETPASPDEEKTPEELEAIKEAARAQYEALERQRFEQAFGVERQRRAAALEAAREAAATRQTRYFVVEELEGAPQLDYDATIVCAYRPGSATIVHLQCDHEAKRCLVAEEAVFRELRASEGGEEGALVPTNQSPDLMRGCAGYASEEDFEQLVARGYELVPALLEIPYGYRRDERGRAFQVFFDLRSRLLLGVYWAGTLRDGYVSSLGVQMKASYEHFGRESRRRHRFRFIEGDLTLAPLTARALLFDYVYGDLGDKPLFYITEFIGEPSRKDVYMRLGKGITLGELEYHTIQERPDQAFLDFVEVRLQWELLQGFGLEDYLAVWSGVGVGTRQLGAGADPNGIYLYPEFGFKGVWLKSPRGLLELSTQGYVRQGWEPGVGLWQKAVAGVSAEWVMLSISDQPLSLFVEPQATYLNVPTDDVQMGDLRIWGGMRLSMFVPPPTSPAELRERIDPRPISYEYDAIEAVYDDEVQDPPPYDSVD